MPTRWVAASIGVMSGSLRVPKTFHPDRRRRIFLPMNRRMEIWTDTASGAHNTAASNLPLASPHVGSLTSREYDYPPTGTERHLGGTWLIRCTNQAIDMDSKSRSKFLKLPS